jgi:hypothetical protein
LADDAPERYLVIPASGSVTAIAEVILRRVVTLLPEPSDQGTGR